MHLLQAAGVRAGAVQNAEDVNEHDPQMAHRDVFFELDHPVIGEARFEGVPFTATQFAPDHWRSAPLLGEDNDYVYGTILGSERRRDRRADRTRSDLSGRLANDPPQRHTPACKVVELADDPGGEMTGLQFVNLGAEVIKVEPPDGAPSRHVGPYRRRSSPTPIAASPSGTTTAASAASSSTSTSDDGRAELRSTCSPPPTCSSSPCIPAGCASLGLDLAAIAAARPTLIVLSITDFGLTGPWADYQSSDLVALATSGLLITSGYDDHTIPPIRPGGNQAYHTAASFAHQAVLLAPAAAPADRRRRAHRPLHPGGRRGHRRVGQPVLVLPPGTRATPDLPSRPTGAHAVGDLPVRRRAMGLLRADPGRSETVERARAVDGQPSISPSI